MPLVYVDDPSRYVGEVVMVAAPGGHGRRERRDKRELDEFTANLIEVIGARTGLPFITQQERDRLLAHCHAELGDPEAMPDA